MNVCVVGLGTVGKELFCELSKKFETYGIDIQDKSKEEFWNSNVFHDYRAVENCELVFVCVQTPLNNDNSPNTEFIDNATLRIAEKVKKGMIIIYESTVYPNYIENKCIPLLKKISGLEPQRDFYVVYSPERISPGDKSMGLTDEVKLVSCPDEKARKTVCSAYNLIGVKTYECETIMEAELSKLFENIQRDVNIALMNEFSQICHEFSTSPSAVFKAARTKSNFLKFYPGLVGGGCVPVNPYYLLSQINGYSDSLISHARKINESYVNVVVEDIVAKFGKHKKICILGASYKRNTDDVKNSGPILVYHLLQDKLPESSIFIHDPYIDKSIICSCPYEELIKMDAYIIGSFHDWYRDLNFYRNKPVYDLGNGFPENFSSEYYSYSYM